MKRVIFLGLLATSISATAGEPTKYYDFDLSDCDMDEMYDHRACRQRLLDPNDKSTWDDAPDMGPWVMGGEPFYDDKPNVHVDSSGSQYGGHTTITVDGESTTCWSRADSGTGQVRSGCE